MTQQEQKLVQLLYQPTLNALAENVDQMGKSLKSSCIQMAEDMSLDNCDRLMSALNGASAGIRQIRTRLVADVERET
jgi:hypothetical protein